ncbi:MAG: hypothetical protein PHO48_04805 [Candidatus Gracilibacteria bacterium]|jgi:hypothetical protein|nr:hypothetical protein [Candidatus Gracilibacteria bacterium]MDD5179549.1 hypothetical protein [Candidatus Gracilibacteria bacterium]
MSSRSKFIIGSFCIYAFFFGSAYGFLWLPADMQLLSVVSHCISFSRGFFTLMATGVAVWTGIKILDWMSEEKISHLFSSLNLSFLNNLRIPDFGFKPKPEKG